MAQKTIEIADKPTLDLVKSGIDQIIAGGISGGGGIAPSNMIKFNAVGANGCVKLYITEPSDTIIENQLLCTISGVKIMRKDTDFPNTENAGIEIIDIPRSDFNKYSTEPYIDDGLINGNTYYYSAFPYSDSGNYNRNPMNRVKATCKMCTIYGFTYDGDLADPDTKIDVPASIRGFDLDNYGYENAKMNFGDSFNWGSWSKEVFFMPKSCMLDRTTLKPAYYLNEDNEALKEDVTASDYKNSSSTLDAMMEWGQNDQIIYMSTIPNESGEGGSILFSDEKLDDTFLDYPFRDVNGNQTKHFYTAKYFGSSDGARMRSLSGMSNYVNNTAQVEVNLARANNTNGNICYDTLTVAQWILINNLLILMAGNTNTQATYGYGRCASSNSSAIAPGTMDGKGMFWGTNDQTSGVKVFGMENWWGNIWRRIRGYINANGTIKIKFTLSNFDGSTTTDYNFDGSNYITISGATPSGTNGGYTNKVKFIQYGFIPVTASGSDSTHLCDGLWFDNGQNNYAFVGGDWYGGLRVGAFCVALDAAASRTGANFGSSLSCTPLAA